MLRDDARVYQALHRARPLAYGPGEFVGQESLMRASEILSLARRAGVGPQASVLDLCCGVAGPGRMITRALGCTYVGLDRSLAAVAIARARAADLDCRFEVAEVPPLPPGQFDVVLLLETMLAFPDKAPLLRAVAAAQKPGGRFAFTVEEGAPLTDAERGQMPNAGTVWPVPMPELLASLEQVGLRARWQEELTASHVAVADALIEAFVADAAYIAACVGRRTLDAVVATHRVWRDWLGEGRIRKFAVVAEKTTPSSPIRFGG